MNTARFSCSMLTLVFVANVGQADLSLPGATGTLSCVAEETSEPLFSNRSSSLNKGSIRSAIKYASYQQADLLK